MILNISHVTSFDFFQYNTAKFLAFSPSISSICNPNYPFWIQFLYPIWIIKVLSIK